MYFRPKHPTDRSNETSRLQEPWSWSDLEDLARFANDPEVRAEAGRLLQLDLAYNVCMATKVTELLEKAGIITVIDLTCEELAPDTVDDVPSSEPDEERQQ